MADESNRQRRHPQNLQGLLRFAVENTRAEDAPDQPANRPPPMTEERRRFLEQALAHMTVNIVEELEAAASQLTNPAATEAEQLAALDHILDHVDNMDAANDFCKIGGLDAVLPCLTAAGTTHAVRRRSADLIAELAQNNPYCQKKLLEHDAMKKLLPLLDMPLIQVSVMRAVSACVRSYEPFAAAFIAMGGLECVLGCLQTADSKLLMHSLFLLRSLSEEYPAVKDELIKLNGIQPICLCLKATAQFDAGVEAALSTLEILTDDTANPSDASDAREVNAHARKLCYEPALSLRTKLGDIIKQGKNKDELLETVQFAETLVKRLFAASNSSSQVDR